MIFQTIRYCVYHFHSIQFNVYLCKSINKYINRYIYLYIYIGVATDRGGFSLGKLPSPRSVLGFRWEMIFQGSPVQVVTEEQASAVETHGVNLPGPWLSALQWDKRRANLQARCARNLFQISCVLGVPKPVELPSKDSFLPGGCHVLHLPDGRRVEHVLCARLRGSWWYCHPGSVRGVEISLIEPFAAHDLVLLDVRRRRWQRSQSCRAKRLPPQT